jgi:hypothetical protein
LGLPCLPAITFWWSWLTEGRAKRVKRLLD